MASIPSDKQIISSGENPSKNAIKRIRTNSEFSNKML